MRRTALLPLIIVPLLAGCSSSADNASRATSAGAAPAPAKAQAVSEPALERAVIRTARIAVHVKSTNATANEAVSIATDQHGRVDSDERSQDGHGSATLVLRIPPSRVERTLSELAKLGTETSRSVSDKDVTAQTVDVMSRVATQRASVARVRALLARAQSLTDITRIEGELTRREADLESLQNRQQALAGQVDLASVTVALTGSSAPIGPGRHAGFTHGLEGGWSALT
ncbi:MAG: DUF4349 domain-containing protein, partial [Mycobacteriales bacterium]